MNIEEGSPIFPGPAPSPELLAQLQGRQVEAECRLLRMSGGEMEDESEREVILQVVDQAVLQRSANGHLLSYFLCDY